MYGTTDCNLDNNERVSKIFRVVPNEKTLREPKSSSRSNILLLHGTKAPNVKGILRSGFKPSETDLVFILLVASVVRTTMGEVSRK